MTDKSDPADLPAFDSDRPEWAQAHGPLRSFGRIKSRPIKARQAALFDTLMPQIAVPDPTKGPIDPAALIVPGVDAARRKRERHRRGNSPGRVLAPVVVADGVASFDVARRHLVSCLQTGHQFACRENLDLEIAVGRLGHPLGQHLGRTIDRVERFRERRGQAPGYLGRGLRDGGRSKCPGRSTAKGGFGQE